MEFLKGKKTYIGAGLFFLLAAYQFFLADDKAGAAQSFSAGLALVGLRSAIAGK